VTALAWTFEAGWWIEIDPTKSRAGRLRKALASCLCESIQ
jgi:hypothetical protein